MQSKQQPAGQRGARQPAQEGSVSLVRSPREFNALLEKDYGAELVRLIPQTLVRAGILSAERLIGQAVTAWRNSAYLQQCNVLTIANSLGYAAELGLEVNTLRGHAYLIPYKQVCTLQPGYKGLLELGYRAGRLGTTKARTVYVNEPFKYIEGSEPFVEYEPITTPGADLGPPRGVLFHATFRDGARDFFYFMTQAEIDRIRDKSSKSAYDKDNKLTGPWKDWAARMSEKTCVKQALKGLHLGGDVGRAITLDDEAIVHGRQRHQGSVVEVSDYKLVESLPLAENAVPMEPMGEKQDAKKAPPDPAKASMEYKGALKGENFTQVEWDEVLNGYTELWGWNQAKAEANLAGWKKTKGEFLDAMRTKLKEKRGAQ